MKPTETTICRITAAIFLTAPFLLSCEDVNARNTSISPAVYRSLEDKTFNLPKQETSNPPDSILPGYCYYGKTPEQLFKLKRTVKIPDSLSDSRYNISGYYSSPQNRYLIRKSGVSAEVSVLDIKRNKSHAILNNLNDKAKDIYRSIYDSCIACAEYFYQNRNKYLKDGAFGEELEFEATEFHTYNKGVLVVGKFKYLDSGTITQFELKRLNIFLKLDYLGNVLGWIIDDPMQIHTGTGTYQLLFAERTFYCIHLNEFDKQDAIMTICNLGYCCGYDSLRNTNVYMTAHVNMDWNQHRITRKTLGPIQASDGMRQRWTSEYFPSVKLVQYKSIMAWTDQVEPNFFIHEKNGQKIVPVKFSELNIDTFKSYSQVKGFDKGGNFYSNYAIFDININKRNVFVSFSEKGGLALLVYDLKRQEIVSAFQMNRHVLISVDRNKLTFKDTKSYLSDGQTRFTILKMR
jgi:hypothetical protein